MDFVPPHAASTATTKSRSSQTATAVKVAKTAKSISASTQKPATRTIAPTPTPTSKPKATALPTQPATPTTSSQTVSVKSEPKLGIIEDLHPNFIKTDVAKRPLSPRSNTPAKTPLQIAKSQKVGLKQRKASTSAPSKTTTTTQNAKTSTQAFTVPKSPFINQGKIAKRPLSKNVYQKAVPEHTTEPTGTVTIISKPDKDAHIGIVIAIILTIVLGAAAGTVAFLLLPK